MATRVRSYSKINLGLNIGAVRADGFHALSTIYQTLALHDVVTIEVRNTPNRPSSIALMTNDIFVPTNAKNTAWRMVESALKALGMAAEVHIHIEKRLPVQAGLGGGSANAVAALIGLERELGYAGAGSDPMWLASGIGDEGPARPVLSQEERLRIAAEIGSDVPLFLLGGTMLGLGRGELVQPLPDLPEMECVIAAPGIGVSTPEAFRDWDAIQSSPAALTGRVQSDTFEGLSRSFAAVLSEPHSSGVFSWREGLAENPLLALVRTGIENDFEQVVFPKYPLLGAIKRELSGSGAGSGDPEHAAIYTSLSGSGSALFGLYPTADAADAAVERLKVLGRVETSRVETKGTQAVAAFRTRTLPRREYWSNMVVEQSA